MDRELAKRAGLTDEQIGVIERAIGRKRKCLDDRDRYNAMYMSDDVRQYLVNGGDCMDGYTIDGAAYEAANATFKRLRSAAEQAAENIQSQIEKLPGYAAYSDLFYRARLDLSEFVPESSDE